MSVGYPKFETTVFAESPEISELLAPLPSVRRALFEEGVPRRFLGDIYYADPCLTLVTIESNGVVVRFGSSGLRRAIGIDIATGNVIQVIDGRQKLTIPVNTALDLFTLTVKALIDRFPYYPKGADVEQIKSVCEDLRVIIRSIDPKAAAAGWYWPNLVDDMLMGDHGTEDILAW
jgi:hypothetical protein